MTPLDMLWMIATPAVIAAVSSLGSRPWKSNARQGWVLPISIGIALAATLAIFMSRSLQPVSDYSDWIVYFLPVAVVGGIAIDLTRWRGLRWLLAILIIAVCVYLPLRLRSSWTTGQLAGVVAGVGACGVVVAFLLDALQRRERSVLVSIVLPGTLLGAGLCVQFTGSMVLGQMLLMLAGAAAGSVLVGSFCLSANLSPGAIVAVLAVASSLLGQAVYWSKTPGWVAMVFVGVALSGWIVALPGVKCMKPWQRTLIGIAVAAIAAASLTAALGVKFMHEYNQTGPSLPY